MFAILKALAGGVMATGTVQAKIRSAKQTAGTVAVLTVCAFVTATAGVVCLAAAIYLALRPLMADYQAALAVGGGLLALAGIAVLLAIARLRRSVPGGGSAAPAPEVPAHHRQGGHDGRDPLVQLISESAQSPVVMSALAMGIVVGRATKRARRD